MKSILSTAGDNQGTYSFQRFDHNNFPRNWARMQYICSINMISRRLSYQDTKSGIRSDDMCCSLPGFATVKFKLLTQIHAQSPLEVFYHSSHDGDFHCHLLHSGMPCLSDTDWAPDGTSRAPPTLDQGCGRVGPYHDDEDKIV
jgi:hypothetical protein